MKKIFLICILLTTQSFAAQVKEVPVDFEMHGIQLKAGQMLYGWKLIPWQEWLSRKSAALIIPTNRPASDLEVFEARAAAVVNKPISYFTEANLLNINTIRKLNPQNKHQVTSANPLVVETTVPFPKKWAEVIAWGKELKILAPKNTDYLKMESTFIFFSGKDIASSQEFAQKLAPLKITDLPLAAVNLQGTSKVNQIAEFISIGTLFYKVDEQNTLVVSFAVAALKKHILQMGISKFNLNGRSVILGENAINKGETQGIGAGLPKYFQEFYSSMVDGLQN